MRTAIDINNSNGHTVRNNVIQQNHTGLILRNQTDNITFVENQVTDNRTVGVLFLDGSGGSNVPAQSALNCAFTNNNISGNWYGEIVDRQSGGSLPAPGTNPKNFQGNWYGSTAPVVTTANSAEPAYASLIPTYYGGSATNPGGQPDIAGPASANFHYLPLLTSGTDTNVETAAGRGTFGFQGSPAVITPSFLDGWAAVSQRTASGTFVAGPATPPYGSGSYHMVTGAGNSGPDLPQGGAGQGGKTWLTHSGYSGVRLADISTLRYSTYVVARQAGTELTPSLQLQVDLDNNGTRDMAMVFEPVYSVGTQGATTLGAWQTWDARAGNWWFTGTTVFGGPQAVFPTYSAILAAYPNARIINWYNLADGYGVQFQAGQNSAGSPWANFDGYVDGFTLGMETGNTTFDFEATTPTVTINQAVGQNDPAAAGPINFTVTFSEPVTGFTGSDVVLSGSGAARCDGCRYRWTDRL